MTQGEFTEFAEMIQQRWPFYKVNEEREKKLWAMFRDFPLSTLRTAAHAYDLANPDATYQSFKLKELLNHCFEEQQTAGDAMSWCAADEAQLALHLHDLHVMGELQHDSEMRFAVDQLRKPQAPSKWQRDEAARKLREMGAKPVSMVARTQDENNAAYDKYLRVAASQVKVIARREQSVETYRERARRMNAQAAVG